MTECKPAPNESAARKFSFLALGIVAGQQPKGTTYGTTCGTKWCVAKEHVILREWNRPVEPKWTGIAEQIAALPIDGILIMRDYPHGYTARYALQGGVANTKAGRSLRFLVRQIPSGGIRIIRTGTHGCLYEGTESVRTETEWRTAYAAAPLNGLAPGALFLGMLWGTGSKASKYSCCEVKACPRPVSSVGMCRYHKRFFASDSRAYGGRIDLRDIYPSEEGGDPKLYTGMLYEDAFSWKRVQTFINGGYRYKEEKISNDWWEKNVDGAEIVRKSSRAKCK